MTTPYTQAKAALDFLLPQLPPSLQKPRVGVICGSGLSGLAGVLSETAERREFAYEDVPGFPVSMGNIFLSG